MKIKELGRNIIAGKPMENEVPLTIEKVLAELKCAGDELRQAIDRLERVPAPHDEDKEVMEILAGYAVLRWYDNYALCAAAAVYFRRFDGRLMNEEMGRLTPILHKYASGTIAAVRQAIKWHHPDWML